MVIAVKVTIRNQQAFDNINKIVLKMPDNIADAGHEFAKLVQRNLRLELTRNQTIWRRKLWNNIQARKKSKFRSEVFMAQEGVWLDRAKPHHVKLKRGRLIHRWAMQKGREHIQRIAQREGSIYVRPHPFIDSAMARSFNRLRPILKRRADKALKGG